MSNGRKPTPFQNWYPFCHMKLKQSCKRHHLNRKILGVSSLVVKPRRRILFFNPCCEILTQHTHTHSHAHKYWVVKGKVFGIVISSQIKKYNPVDDATGHIIVMVKLRFIACRPFFYKEMKMNTFERSCCITSRHRN